MIEKVREHVAQSEYQTGVCNSSPFVGQSPFLTFGRAFQPDSMVHMFVEMFEMEIYQQMGEEWHTPGIKSNLA